MSNPRIQLRHDTATNWSTANPVLLDGEVGIEKGSSFDANVVLEFPNIAAISNNGIMTMPTKPTGLTNDQINYAIHTNEPIPIGRTPNPLFDCKFRIKPTDNSKEFSTIFRQYITQHDDEGYTWDISFHIKFSSNELELSYNNWGASAACQLPSDYLNKYYTYRVYLNQLNAPPTVEIIDDNDTVVSSGGGNSQYIPNEPSSLEGVYTVIGSSWDNWFIGEMDLNNCNMTFLNGTWTWDGGTATPYTKLKIGDGETAWNNLPYIT